MALVTLNNLPDRNNTVRNAQATLSKGRSSIVIFLSLARLSRA